MIEHDEDKCEECGSKSIVYECLECGDTEDECEDSDCDICEGNPRSTGSFRCKKCNEITFG